MTTKKISIILIVCVVTAVTMYASILLFLIWPITEYSIAQAGVFGDSFGVLTSLFSGLAFSGMIITILLQKEELVLQREELKENRKEFAKGAEAQERNAQLSALSALLAEYKSQISINQSALEKQYKQDQISGTIAFRSQNPLENENIDLIKRKGIIIVKIEEILQDSGVNLGKNS